MANSVIFINKIDMEDIMSSFDISSFMLVKTTLGATPGELVETIEREIDNVHALTAQQFLINDKKMAMQMGTDTIALMTLIGGALAILLVAFTIYSQAARQRRELAVAKALYASVVFQAIAITLTSVILATLVAALLMPVLSKLIPAVTMLLTVASVSKIAVAGVFVAITASLMPARQIARLDPVSAFQSRG